jgi:glyoxylase I family protein
MTGEKLILKLHHVSFIVEELTRALSFYQDVLGLEVDHSRPDLGYPGAWLTLPGKQQIHLMKLPDQDKNSERPEHGGRDHHAAFTVSSIEKIESSLNEKDMPYTKSRSGRKALFCRDPDGNALEFIQSI